jgi:biotin operon repressor
VRKKLGEDGPQVETIRGLGYRLVPPPRGSADPGPSPTAD